MTQPSSPNIENIDETVDRYVRLIASALDQQQADEVRSMAAEIMQRARKMPVGPDRNELRQAAIGLMWLVKRGLAGKVPNR